MQIEDYIENTALEVDPLITFEHGNLSFLNELDSVNFPVCYLEPIVSSDTFNQAGYLKEVYSVRILFAGKSQLDWKYKQHNVVINSMRVLSRAFLGKIQKDTENVLSISNIRRTTGINVSDINITGIYMQLEIELSNNNTNC